MRNLNRFHLNGLRALEAAGRLGSLRAAAEELGVTVGAVSQQVLKAEEQFGRPVFERHSKGPRRSSSQIPAPTTARGVTFARCEDMTTG